MFQKNKISACIGMLFGSMLIVGGTQAQIAPPPDYDQNLKSVTLSATRSGTPLDEIPLNTTILTKEALEIAPDQTSLEDVFVQLTYQEQAVAESSIS